MRDYNMSSVVLRNLRLIVCCYKFWDDWGLIIYNFIVSFAFLFDKDKGGSLIHRGKHSQQAFFNFSRMKSFVTKTIIHFVATIIFSF
jgi:hypothetical protein